jgi:hypothetical protein
MPLTTADIGIQLQPSKMPRHAAGLHRHIFASSDDRAGYGEPAGLDALPQLAAEAEGSGGAKDRQGARHRFSSENLRTVRIVVTYANAKCIGRLGFWVGPIKIKSTAIH